MQCATNLPRTFKEHIITDLITKLKIIAKQSTVYCSIPWHTLLVVGLVPLGLYLPTVILTVIWYSITHSLFLSRLKTFLLQILPTAALPFFYLNIYYVDSLDCLLLFLSISLFYFSFFLFLHFLVLGSVR